MIKDIESVQRRATKIVPKIKNLTYPDRLKALNLPTLSYKRLRGDMIEVYKIIANIYDSNTCQNISNLRQNNVVNLRGHQYTLKHKNYTQLVELITLQTGLLKSGTLCQKR